MCKYLKVYFFKLALYENDLALNIIDMYGILTN